MGEHSVRQGIGYWGNGGQDQLPRPQALVRVGWRRGEQSRIATYLQNGDPYFEYLGFATCRFRDCRRILGTADLTDGEWVWPAQLEHYIIEHSVCLPDAFVASMASREWQVPSTIPPRPDEVLFHTDFWWQWAAEYEAEYSRTHPPTGIDDRLP